MPPYHHWTYYSIDKVDMNASTVVPPNVEYLSRVSTFTPAGMPSHKLRLCVGAVVMLLRNISVQLGLCNGTRMVVTELNKYSKMQIVES
jgi:hypothetical protein